MSRQDSEALERQATKVAGGGNGARMLATVALLASVSSCAALAVGFWLGKSQPAAVEPLPQIFADAATATDSMAVATGPVSKDAEGIFFLDFLTGDLQCLVYYPRVGVFGARYFANVQQQLGGGKNSKYLLVTGQATTPASSGTVRPGGSLVYVTDVTSGRFAAYIVPFDTTLESRRQSQAGSLVPVAVGPIRNFELRDPAQNQPAAIIDPNNR